MQRIIVALDVESPRQALAIAGQLRGLVAGFKVGSQLFTAEGPAFVRQLVEAGDRVFLDLKFHDIPNTVARAASAAARLGVWMFNVHASGGAEMMRAAREGAYEEGRKRGRVPLVTAVTVLTSLDEAGLASLGVARPLMDHVEALAMMAREAGLDGVVASPREVGRIRERCGGGFLIVTPGIRGGAAAVPSGTPRADDQARTLGARQALEAGASYLVIGRPIVADPDPAAAAARIASELSGPVR
ncbi:MAG: orotidine-5'-phosphate decarboxylase [Vicinamibacterales bacterium]